MLIVPEIGNLYQFKERDKKLLLEKYKFYYTGLALCVIVDITKDLGESRLTEEVKDYIEKNPIFGFETYNSVQYFDDMIPEGIKTADILFLTFQEVNDMLEPAHAD